MAGGSIQPLNRGEVEPATYDDHDGRSVSNPRVSDIGRVYYIAGRKMRLVQVTGSLASAASKALVTAFNTSGAPTWICSTTTTSAANTFAGVVPANITEQGTTSGQLEDGDILLLDAGGASSVLLETTDVVDGDLLMTSTTAGNLHSATWTANGDVVVGRARNTTEVTAAGLAGGITLFGQDSF